MFSIQQPLLVFSDLDGTLLDSHSYDWQPAAPWLSRLREANVPVILCSSKTSAEMLYLQKTLGLQGLPLIAENGAVIQLAEQWQDIDGFPRIISGISHGEISQVLNTLREKEHFKFTTFDDVDDATIAEWTGLSRSQACSSRGCSNSVTAVRSEVKSSGATRASRMPLRKKISLSTLYCKCLSSALATFSR